MEEEGGEEDTGHVERESEDESEVKKNMTMKQEDPPDHITDCANDDVDPSELLTEADSVVFTTTTTTTIVLSGESKVSYSGEDNEGGMSVEDLQRGFREEVHSGEEREEEWQNDKQNDGEGETRDICINLINNIYTN